MAIEKSTNNAATTLSAAITTPTATSCTMTDATGFPTSGNFRIKIDAEILIVTAVVGNTFTVTRGAEGTTAATHASGANVIHILTKGGLEARVANRFISDLYANKPAAGVKGRLFLPTDGLFLEYDDGSAWHQYGPFRRFKAPPQSGWQWVNQGNATATFVGSALLLEDPDLDANNPQLRLYVRPLAAGTTSIVAAFAYHGAASMNGPKAGFCARCVGGSDDGNLTTWGLREWQTSSYPFLEYVNYTSPTATENTPSIDGRQVWPWWRVFWVKFEWAGNYKRFYYSVDGVNWIKWTEDSFGNYNTPNQFGIFIDPMNNANKISLSLLHWEES
jgi:hypothetical protein